MSNVSEATLTITSVEGDYWLLHGTTPGTRTDNGWGLLDLVGWWSSGPNKSPIHERPLGHGSMVPGPAAWPGMPLTIVGSYDGLNPQDAQTQADLLKGRLQNSRAMIDLRVIDHVKATSVKASVREIDIPDLHGTGCSSFSFTVDVEAPDQRKYGVPSTLTLGSAGFNFVPNPTVANNLTGWAGVVDGAPAPLTSVLGLAQVTPGAAAVEAGVRVGAFPVSVPAGNWDAATLRSLIKFAGIRVRTSRAKPVTMSLTLLNSLGNVIDVFVAPEALTSANVVKDILLGLEDGLPAAAAQAVIHAYVPGPFTASDTLQFDAAFLGATPTYGDGSSQYWQWLGTPHASMSYSTAMRVINGGTAPTPARLVVRGVTNLIKLSDIATGRWVEVTTPSTRASDVVVIDTGTPHVVSRNGQMVGFKAGGWPEFGAGVSAGVSVQVDPTATWTLSFADAWW